MLFRSAGPARTIREKDLDHHLPGEGEKEPPEKAPTKPSEKIQDPGKKPAAGGESKEDPPLERALELLKTWRILNKTQIPKAS